MYSTQHMRFQKINLDFLPESRQIDVSFVTLNEDWG